MGQPLEFALSACVLAMRLGEALGYSEDALREIYYQSLLRYIGCNVDTQLLAALVGDEFAFRADFALIDNGSAAESIRLMLRYIHQANAGINPLALAHALLSGFLTMPQVKARFSGHCEVAQRLAQRLGFEPNIVYALGQLYERWDGKGVPNGLKGETIAPAVLVVTLAQDALLFYRLGNLEAAVKVVRERNGTAYAPLIVECFCEHAPRLFIGSDSETSWETVLDLEPGKREWLSEEGLDNACRVLADFVDIKSPSTLNHSHHVAQLAADAAQRAGLPATDVGLVRRAGWLHDIGKTGLSASILEKPGKLSAREWEQVQMHPYYVERILALSGSLSKVGRLASLHHERLDGAGYHRGLLAEMIPIAAQILAVANTYCALTENRPYRIALAPDTAAEALGREVRAGRFGGEVVNAVLGSAGHSAPRPETIAGLSDRELEVLRLLAKGHSTRNIATLLVISPKTADHHIQHIYNKIGVSTRAGATLFAMEHHLLQ